MSEKNNDEVEIAVEESAPEPVAKANGVAPVIEETKVDIVNENENGSDIETSEKAVENIDEMEGSDAVEADAEREADRDSLVPGTGSINGDIEGGYDDESDEGEEDIDDDDENMSNVVQGTTETILNKLEENLAQAPEVDESDLLQVIFSHIGSLSTTGPPKNCTNRNLEIVFTKVYLIP